MVSRRFGELEVAHSWHIPPHLWDSYPEESRAEMMAFTQVKAQMQTYEHHLAEKKSELQRQARGVKR